MKQFVGYYFPHFNEDIENDTNTIYNSVKQNKNVVQAAIGWDTWGDRYISAESKDGYSRKLYVVGKGHLKIDGARTFFRMSEVINWLSGTNNAIEYNLVPTVVRSNRPYPYEIKNVLTWSTLPKSQNEHAVIPLIKRIQLRIKKGTIYTTVIWADGSDPTVVKRAKDDPNDLYFAVASAIAIKMYGSNSAFKRMINDSLLPSSNSKSVAQFKPVMTEPIRHGWVVSGKEEK